MFKNGMRSVHPGEILLENYAKTISKQISPLALAA